MPLEIERKFLVCGESRKDATEATEIGLIPADGDFEFPPWLGEEVSFDSRFDNSALAVNPYNRW